MVKNLITASTIVLSLTAFSPVSAQKLKHNGGVNNVSEVSFLNDIEINLSNNAPADAVVVQKDNKPVKYESQPVTIPATYSLTTNAVEALSALQLKYGILLNIEVELIKNLTLYRAIDEWYGTPYRYGGCTKNGVDCSAFVQAIYTALFGIMIPRTAREQYGASQQIKREELQEGDLVFFNTTGGVSHVGIYLQNNKFVHAAVSEGVMVSDLDDSYWSRRYIGAGHMDIASLIPIALPALTLPNP